LVDRLTGVDLSPAMVAKAGGKAIYDRLATGDLTGFLTGEAETTAQYQIVLAADVFVYVNDLEPVVVAAARVLAPQGLFAFTVETHSGDGVKLLPTLRYAHGERYIRDALEAAGLEPARIEAVAVRSEKGAPVESLVVVAGPKASFSGANGT
jgi:predicted TPR repeat methyltransferase